MDDYGNTLEMRQLLNQLGLPPTADLPKDHVPPGRQPPTKPDAGVAGAGDPVGRLARPPVAEADKRKTANV